MSTHTDSSPPDSGTGGKRFKPHQLVIGIGCFMGLFTLVSGILPQITKWHDTRTPVARGLRGHPRRAAGRVLHGHPGHAGVGRDRVRRSCSQLGARRSRSPAHDVEERQAPPRRLPCRCVHAHAAARLGCRVDALADLLRVPRSARRHDRARGRPPAARERQVPARPDLHGLLDVRRSRRPRVRRRHRLGDPAPLRATPLPDSHQDQARARRDPRHVLPHRRLRVLRRSIPHRRDRPTELREVELHRLPDEQVVRRRVAHHPRSLAPDHVGQSTSSASSCSSRCCRSRCCGTCSPRRSTCTCTIANVRRAR